MSFHYVAEGAVWILSHASAAVKELAHYDDAIDSTPVNASPIHHNDLMYGWVQLPEAPDTVPYLHLLIQCLHGHAQGLHKGLECCFLYTAHPLLHTLLHTEQRHAALWPDCSTAFYACQGASGWPAGAHLSPDVTLYRKIVPGQ